jgi:hypothetical protein
MTTERVYVGKRPRGLRGGEDDPLMTVDLQVRKSGLGKLSHLADANIT